ncbi:hypothetical protein N5J52_05955 [Stenotrophomonas maltophilia]|uniref:hypothetical protein n=2 Tax=Stenotrophomonas maltophilia TaxID=40324 RepID=UPI00066E52EC|nr:hypothetical protein [Stenotrophomonas maltophilia]ASE53586.1 hypothetical protein CEQ03_13090 [Stenotrophomonas maltophilia]MDH2062448.1 hypothetical protein [Stenotrophomonas maltophilia]HDX0900712.1 hypothetical protein [Stenotrophomonas maltophilia]HEL3012037.1 hypothetical protein [Stenotrophomonas maltophilia]HEL5083687.1 hypothetical protein [Stenotrophomonas maltophilia]
MTAPHQGIVHATVLAPDLQAFCVAYITQLAMGVQQQGTLDAADAVALDLPDLAGAPLAWLTNSAGQPVLRVIEDRKAAAYEPMFHHGWLSLGILVGDIDALAAGLHAPFRMLGAPTDLELSDAIRAAQVLGPAGELLYLNQVKAAVPPFDLPMTQDAVATPFIGVISTPDRAASHAAWSALLGTPGWMFDTKITVLNRAHGKPLQGQYPVAVVPMPGQCLVEIDQVELSPDHAQRRTGLYSLCLCLPEMDDSVLHAAGWRHLFGSKGRRGLRGPAGEHVELLRPDVGPS